MTDLDIPVWQDMLLKPAGKFCMAERHFLYFTLIRIVLVFESNRLIRYLLDTMCRDSHFMCVSEYSGLKGANKTSKQK